MRSLFQLLSLAAIVQHGSASAVPPTRNLPLLSMQPAFCGQQFHTNYVWLAQAHLACLGMPPSCGGGTCGTLSINGQTLNITNFNSNNNDVCGACEGCPIVFVGFPASIPNAAHAFEGKDAALVYTPPVGAPAHDAAALPDCPALPSPWKKLPNKQISPKCSPSESKGSLGVVVATAADCLAKAKANGKVNYAVWRGDTDKSCDVCAFPWRGPAEGWKFSVLSGATSFAWYPALPAPKPSGPCPACPPNSASATTAALTLSSGSIKAEFGTRGLETVASLGENGFKVSVSNDAFALALDGDSCACSSGLAAPTMTHNQAAVSYVFASPSQQLTINVTYELRPGAFFVSKSLTLTDTADDTSGMVNDSAVRVRMVNTVSAMDGAILTSHGKASIDTRTSNSVQFLRWADAASTSLNRTSGAFLTAQNSFVQPSPSLAWTLDQNWTVGLGPRTLDSAIIGLYESARTSQLESAEAAAVTAAVEHFLVAPSADNVTVKINIGERNSTDPAISQRICSPHSLAGGYILC